MKNITATYKGLITGAAMIIVSILIYVAQGNFEGNLQYIVYCMYVAGIIWTLLDHKKKTGYATFKEYFSQGFKCFIVVTLFMVLFNLFFILLHPEFKDAMVANMQTELIKEKNMMPSDVEKTIANAKKIFLPAYLMGAVFSYLLIGVLITVIGSGFLSAKKSTV